MLQYYNAGQLSKWCLHFISSNYIAFCPRPEWSQLSADNLQHIEEHRWPPVDYLNEVKEYEARIEKNKLEKRATQAGDIRCLIM